MIKLITAYTSNNHQVTNYPIKNGIGDGEAKELMCTTHGHELRWGMLAEGENGGNGTTIGA